jgi:hypothetical protein
MGLNNTASSLGGKLCFILNQCGVVCVWDCAMANVYEAHFHPLIAQFDNRMIVLTDTGFHAKTGAPTNMNFSVIRYHYPYLSDKRKFKHMCTSTLRERTFLPLVGGSNLTECGVRHLSWEMW